MLCYEGSAPITCRDSSLTQAGLDPTQKPCLGRQAKLQPDGL